MYRGVDEYARIEGYKLKYIVGDEDRENRRVEKINRNMTTRTSKVILVFIFFSSFDPSGEVDARALRLYYSRYTQYYTRIIPPLLRVYLLCILYIYIYMCVCVCMCVLTKRPNCSGGPRRACLDAENRTPLPKRRRHCRHRRREPTRCGI